MVYTKYKEDSTVIRFISPNTDTSKYYYLSGVQLVKSTGVLSSYFINFNVRSGIVNSETATSGQVLTADGTGGASWVSPSTPSVEGTAVLSTGETSGKVLTADGTGGASWQTAGGGGSQLYEHNISFTFGSGRCSLTIVNNVSTAYAGIAQIRAYLVDNGLNSQYKVKTASLYSLQSSKLCYATGIFGQFNSISAIIMSYDGQSELTWNSTNESISNFNDIVITL